MNHAFPVVGDIGAVKLPGSTAYDEREKTYTLSGSGKNLWFSEDEFHFAARRMSGDFAVTCTLRFIGEGVEPHRKAGLMIRSALETSSAYADAAVHGDGLTSLQYRPADGEDTLEVRASITAAATVRLERRGDTIVMSAAKSGSPLKETGRVRMTLPAEVFVGLFIGSHNVDVIERAEFSDVRIEPSGGATRATG